MRDLGDRAEDSTLRFTFNTTQADGTPITLAGTPSLAVYKDDSTTQSTAGITLTVGFDSVTGLHSVEIDLSADAFYATGSDYSVVIAAGTVDSVSVVGTTLAHFSIQARYMRGTDSAYTGGNITGNLSGSVGSVTGAVGSVTGNVGGNVTGTVASVVGNVGGNVTGSVGSVTGAVGSVTGAVGSVTGNVGGNVTGSVGSLATQAKADVNAEVLDVFVTDTFTEPTAPPAATASLKDKIGYVFAKLRNKRTQDATTETIFRDDGSTTLATSTKSDNGTLFTKGEDT